MTSVLLDEPVYRWLPLADPRLPDPTVTTRLRAELQRARTAGVAFADAWPMATAAAVRGLKRSERDSWADVFRATGWAWADAYRGAAEPEWAGLLSAAA